MAAGFRTELAGCSRRCCGNDRRRHHDDGRFPLLPVPRAALAVRHGAARGIHHGVERIGGAVRNHRTGLCARPVPDCGRVSQRHFIGRAQGIGFPALAGFLSSAAAGATLLSAPVCLVLAIWLAFQNRIGNRWAKLGAFAAAAVVPFLPVVWLFVKGPEQTLFNIIQFNLVFRQVEWSGAIAHDIFTVLLSWLNSAQALLLGLIGVAGILFVHFQSSGANWTKAERAEFYLCGWLALALGFHVSSAHPTFQRYYVFAVPFVVILVAAGMYSLTTRLWADRPFWPMFALTLIFSLELAKALQDRDTNLHWPDLEHIAAKVDQVTPPNGVILSDEQVYFITRRPPPSAWNWPIRTSWNFRWTAPGGCICCRSRK